MTSWVFVPEAVVVLTALVLLIAGRIGGWGVRLRRHLPAGVAAVLLIALAVELWAGAHLGNYLGGALVQDRFALFAKVTALVAAATVIAAADWSAEESLSIGLAMPLLAAFGVMVAASAGDFVALWAGLELAAAAGVVMVSLRRPDVGLRLLLTGGVASVLLLVGFAFIYATAGTADLAVVRQVMQFTAPTLPLAIPVALLFGGLAARVGLAPFHVAGLPAGIGASPVGMGLVLGLVATAGITAAIKVAGALSPLPAVFGSYLTVLAAVAMLVGGAGALAVRSPRARLAYLAAGQVGWLAAGMVTHYRVGLAASLFLLGAFAVAASCGPVLLGGAEGGEVSLAGLGTLRPARAAGIALVFLSLAGAPPLAGFFGEFAVAAALGQSGHFGLLVIGLIGSVMSLAAVLGTLRVVYLQSPLEEGRRGGGTAAASPWSRFSIAGAVAICVVIAGYGAFASPILGLANQGAEALGLR